MIEPGKKAPAFTLKDQDGKTHKLSDYAGHPVVLYFYPKDDTPGCTAEACAFRDNLAGGQVSVTGGQVSITRGQTRPVPTRPVPRAQVLGVSILDEKSKSK